MGYEMVFVIGMNCLSLPTDVPKKVSVTFPCVRRPLHQRGGGQRCC